MNLRDLKYFIAVADTRHFGKAAERCFVSQPTLSGQVKKLENELNVVLFERTNRSVALTPIGKELLAYAQRVVREAEALSEAAKAHSDPLSGALRLGAIPTLSPYLLPLFLGFLRKNYPNLQLVLSEEITDRLTERLLAHEIDAALLATPVDDPGLISQPLFVEPFWLAHPVNHELYSKDDITSDDLDKLEMLLLADGHCLAKQVMDVCRLQERKQAGSMSDLRAASLETLLQLVGAGFGSTLVPALAVRGGWTTDGGIVARQLPLVEDAYRVVTLVWRKSFPRVAAINALREAILSHLPNTVKPL